MTFAPSSRHIRAGLAGFLALSAVLSAQAQGPSVQPGPDDAALLAGFRTVKTALRATEAKASPRTNLRTGYLGVVVREGASGLAVTEIEPESPAEKAGVKVGDFIASIDAAKPKSAAELRDVLQAKEPDAVVKLGVVRAKKPLSLSATLAATSRPMVLNEDRAFLGIQLGEADDSGVPIRRVTVGSPAEKAGLKTGEVVVKVDGADLADSGRLDAILNEKRPGDPVTLHVKREGKEIEVKATLEADPAAASRGTNTFSRRNVWKKDVFRLAIVCIEYPDQKHNDKITSANWNEQLFGKGTYKNKENATGQTVYGSLNDFYQEVSNGALRIEGKVFDWIQVSKNRADYSEGTGTSARSRGTLFNEALTKIVERDGPDALKGFDGVFFLYAGARFPTSRGGLYWPHRSNVRFGGQNWPYFIVQEGGPRMTDISVMAHEFGHMIGLPDLYARPENPGSEGLGVWCLMSNQTGSGRPQHMGAWCKEQLGWLTPTVINPRVPQKLVLSPVSGSSTECFKVLLREDGSEYLLLENRRKTGFDTALPADGLLIWHVVGTRPILEESHGVDGPQGPRSFVQMVPYPSAANNAMTPFTTPSSKSQLGGGLPVYITNIRKLPDGRVTFYVGYEFN